MKRTAAFLAMFAVVAPLAALPEPTGGEIQANRQRFEQLRKHPEVVQKLRSEAEAFFGLEKERLRQIVRVDKDLRQEPKAIQTRLVAVLDRYSDWLLKQDDVTRKKINDARDHQQRLELIRALREQEWLVDQPKALRDRIAKLQGEERRNLIAKEKADERQRRLEWSIAKNFWNELEGEGKGRKSLPTKLNEMPLPVQVYVRDYLQRLFLTPEENDQLAKLAGQWPQYPMKLVELADKHPAALPGPLGPKSIAELPTRLVQNKEFLGPLAPKLLKKEVAPGLISKLLKVPEGKWPELGVALARAAQQRGHIFEHEFLAYKLDCLTPPMQDFVKNKLRPALDGKESLRLADAIGKWPDYPQTIQELAASHHLQPPWFTLPPGENWQGYRAPK